MQFASAAMWLATVVAKKTYVDNLRVMSQGSGWFLCGACSSAGRLNSFATVVVTVGITCLLMIWRFDASQSRLEVAHRLLPLLVCDCPTADSLSTFLYLCAVVPPLTLSTSPSALPSPLSPFVFLSSPSCTSPDTITPAAGSAGQGGAFSQRRS